MPKTDSEIETVATFGTIMANCVASGILRAERTIRKLDELPALAYEQTIAAELQAIYNENAALLAKLAEL